MVVSTTLLRQCGPFFARLCLWSLLVAVGLGIAFCQSNSALAAEREAAAEAPVNFNIPAQPMASALKAYSAATHVALFYDGALAQGQTSTSVQGLFTPKAALRRLLENTDLEAQASDVDTITISRSDAPSAQQLAAIRSRNSNYWPYLSMVQASLRDVLCRAAATQSDASDVLVRFWIAPSGLVKESELLGSTGDPGRDAAYAAALKTLDIGQPPPQGMPQPVTMAILQRPSPRAAGCTATGRSRG